MIHLAIRSGQPFRDLCEFWEDRDLDTLQQHYEDERAEASLAAQRKGGGNG